MIVKSVERPASPPVRFGAVHRARRKLRRLANEMRSILDERLKRPVPRAWPVFVNLHHTAVCNLRCTMCQQAYDSIPQELMDVELYRRVRDELFEHASELSLSVMGDPFCVPKPFLNEILDDVERYDLRLEVTTNATLFGDAAEVERLARLTSRMVVSIDGATKETFERIRVRGRFERVVDNVTRFRDAARRLPFHRRPLMLFNTMVMRSTLDELPAFIDLAKSWDAYEVRGLPVEVIHHSLADEVLDVDDPHVRAVLAEARRRADRHGIRLKLAGHLSRALPPETELAPRWLRVARAPRRGWMLFKPVFSQGVNYLAEKTLHRIHVAERECGYLWNKAYVLINGEISTCCHADFLVTGDLKRAPFAEIWRGRRYGAIRSTLNTDHPAAPCRDCHLLRKR
jgi:MoaA/NifB/PqqE/SkfB family radical SAM enzyme